MVDIDRRGGYSVEEFWEPIAARRDGSLILDPGEFYILASKEAVQIPPDYAAEMVPFDPLVGEFRVHYAGFFDPGFGYAGAGGQGSRAVLEVRSREVPFILEHGQIVGRLVYEKMIARPAALYGQRIDSYRAALEASLARNTFDEDQPFLAGLRERFRISPDEDRLLLHLARSSVIVARDARACARRRAGSRPERSPDATAASRRGRAIARGASKS